MPTETTIEQRLAAVEVAVAALREKLEARPTSPDWLDRLIGSFKDEPAFDEVIEFGRALRAADRPGGDADA